MAELDDRYRLKFTDTVTNLKAATNVVAALLTGTAPEKVIIGLMCEVIAHAGLGDIESRYPKTVEGWRDRLIKEMRESIAILEATKNSEAASPTPKE